jgi:hypothetical protein
MKIRWRCLILIGLLVSAGCIRNRICDEQPDVNPYDEKTELQLLEERLGV